MIDIKREDGLIGCEGSTVPVRRMEWWVAAASLLWALCFVGARQALGDAPEPGAATWLIAALPTMAGIGLLAVYVRYLRRIDELQRAIHLEAMAIGFGGGFLAICAYITFEPLGAPATNPLDLLAVMPMIYALALLVGSGRYR